jgi:nucleoside-diphosphate-sugar epimerase/predicted dehydrogenase
MSHRVALLGAGFIADWHVRALRTLRKVEIVAVCDRAPGLAAAFAQKHHIPHHHQSLDELLAAHTLSAVHVLVPPDAHFPVAERILRAGVPVLLEKPAATRAGEVEALRLLAEARGLRIGVSHNFAFDPTVERLAADLREGRLGAARELTITWNRTLPQLITGPFDLWMLADPKNLLLELGPHPASLLAFLDALPDELRVHASDPLVLPSGVTVFRRFDIEGWRGELRSLIRLSLGAGFQQFSVELRGTLGAATADLENHTYVCHEHSRAGRLGMDTDSAVMALDQARQLGAQALKNLGIFALHKLKVRPEGDWLGLGMSRGFQRFYEAFGEPLDARLSIERARDIITFCERIGDEAKLPAPPPKAPSPARAAAPAAKILVLGGAGFLGQALLQKLVAQGERVRVVARSPGKLGRDLQGEAVEIVRADLTHGAELREAMRGIEVVVHLAKPAVNAWSDYLRLDVEVTRSIAEACLEAGVKRLLYTGTIDSYYAGNPGEIITEQTPLDPKIEQRNEYARSKAVSEALLLDLQRTRGLPLIILRPGIVIGKGPLALHPGVASWSRGAVCRLYGEGHNKLPLVLVDDVADALIAAMRTEGIVGESFNLIGDPLLSAREFVAAIERRARVRLQVIPTPIAEMYAVDLFKYAMNRVARKPELRTPSYRDEQSRTQSAVFECSKAKRILGWRPVSDRDELIRRGIDEAVDLVFA